MDQKLADDMYVKAYDFLLSLVQQAEKSRAHEMAFGFLVPEEAYTDLRMSLLAYYNAKQQEVM